MFGHFNRMVPLILIVLAIIAVGCGINSNAASIPASKEEHQLRFTQHSAYSEQQAMSCMDQEAVLFPVR